MAGEGGKIFGLKEMAVADFNPVVPTPGKFGKEGVKDFDKIAAARKVLGIEAREFEDQCTDVFSEGFARRQKTGDKEIGVEEIRVRLAGPRAGARHVGKALDGDLVRDFEGELKIGRNLRHKALEVAFVRELVIGGVHADGLEDFSVVGQALSFEARGGEFPAPDVTIVLVENAAPALVFPGRGAD